jgi:prepilin-type processing-associated H-X9-DG protein
MLGLITIGGLSTTTAYFKNGQIKKSSEVMLLGDKNFSASYTTGQFDYVAAGMSTQARHKGGMNLGFVDGHAAWKHRNRIPSDSNNNWYKYVMWGRKDQAANALGNP